METPPLPASRPIARAAGHNAVRASEDDGRCRGCGQSAAKTRCKGTRKQCGGVWTTHEAHRTQLHFNRPTISTVLHGGTETHPVHRADVRRPPLKVEALLLVAVVLRQTFVEVGVQSVAVFCLGTRKTNGFAKPMSSKTLVLTKSRGLQRGLTGFAKVAKGLQRGLKGLQSLCTWFWFGKCGFTGAVEGGVAIRLALMSSIDIAAGGATLRESRGRLFCPGRQRRVTVETASLY